jgi:hypothetical protein
MAVVGLTVALIAGASGLAVAYFTSAGQGIGQAQVGTASPILINQIGGTPLYNSKLASGSDYVASLCYYCIANTDLGQRITLADGGGALNDVSVDMANFGGSAGSENMTFTIYAAGTGASPGASLGAVTQDVAFPAGPDGGYGSTYCTSGGGASNPDCGIANFTIDFDFSSQSLTLPATVVYGLSFNDPQTSINGGVNIQLSDTTMGEPSVGSITDPNTAFANTNGAGNGDTGGATGEVTCSPIVSGFTEYSTASTAACGLEPYIPAVEFNPPGFTDLYPGGPAQAINYSLTNPGSGSASVNQVTISVAVDGSGQVETVPGDAATAVAGCYGSWFVVNGSPVTLGISIPAGQTVNEVGTANIQMTNTATDQDACQGVDIGLNFSSD